MTVEVDRLGGENTKLLYRIKEMEDRALDRNSYEHQIRDLQQRLQEVESSQM